MLLIKGLSLLTRNIWHLTVVGNLTMDARYVREIKMLIAQKNLSRQIEIIGPRDGNQLANLFRQSHVFVMPYFQERFGMANLEAMPFGMPVMGSSDGAVKEVVIPGRNGFLFESENFESINVCIHTLHHDRRRLRKMSRAVYQ